MKFKGILFGTLLLASSAFVFSSCDSDGSNEVHFLQVLKPTNVAYADQETDSLSILSTNSWSYYTADTWISPKEIRQSVNSYRTYTYPSSFSANNTGTPRLATMTIDSDGKNIKKISKVYMQTSWLNIVRPQVVLTPADNTITTLYDIEHLNELKANFVSRFTSAAAGDSIQIKLNASFADFYTDNSWIELDGETTGSINNSVRVLKSTNSDGISTIRFAVEANTSSDRRNGKIIVVTSNGITQEILVYQEGKK